MQVKLIPFTHFETVSNSIQPAQSTVTDWYKSSPRRLQGYSSNLVKEGETSATYKQCAPFLDAMTLGYMAVLTSDIEVTLGENNLPFINHKPLARQVVSTHTPEQWQGMPYPLFHHPSVFKWHQDLLIQTPKNYSLLFTHPMNRFDLPFTTMSGVVESDSYNIPTNFPFWLKEGFIGVIAAGTPVCQIIPILRENWSRSLQDFNPNQASINIDNYFSKIVKTYKSIFWQKKIYN